MDEKEFKKLEEVLIQVGLKIAKRGEGAIFVVGTVSYQCLVEQAVPKFKAVNNPKLLESLAIMDGAIILDEDGFVEAYGVMIKSRETLKNFGTRHSAALSAAKGDNLVVMVSEEDKKIRIFRKGKLLLEIDARQKDIQHNIPAVVNILEFIGAGAVGSFGTILLVPNLGLALLPGVVLFGSAYYIFKNISRKFNGYYPFRKVQQKSL